MVDFSMSYGRFFNVRAGEDPSDLDLIIVYENENESELKPTDILPIELGFEEEDQKLLAERLKFFADLKKSKLATVISQKSPIRSLGFEVSMHIMDRETFYHSTLFGVKSDLALGDDVDRRLLDYKPQPFKHQNMIQKDFLGRDYSFPANEEKLAHSVKENEVIAQIPAYAIRDGWFVPGMYHNLVSPRFEFEPLTSPKVSSAVIMYWAMMHDLQDFYRKGNPNASVLKSHIRYPIFSSILRNNYE